VIKHPPKLLVADDSAANREMMSETLRHAPIEILCAKNGIEAVEIASKNKLFLVFMDINMPGIDGIEASRRIHNLDHHSNLPVIFITGSTEPDNIDQCYHAGGVDFITKPYNERILIAKTKIFLQLHHEKVRTHEALIEVESAKKRSELLIHNAGEGIIGLDNDLTITSVNSVACALLLGSKSELISSPIRSVVCSNNDSDEVWNDSPLAVALAEKQNIHVEDTLFHRAIGEPLSVEYTFASIVNNDTLEGGVLIFQDISERKETADKLINLAQCDQLTGLFNRVMFHSLLDQMLSEANRYGSKVALHFLDLDNFKDINDTLGHDAGDQVIKEAAARVEGCVRESDHVARLGGDEFGIIQRLDGSGEVSGAYLAERIIDAFQTPFYINETEAFIGCSIGIALYPEHAKCGQDLIKDADTAMYKSKQSGRNQYHYFSNEMQVKMMEQMELVSALKSALDNNEIFLMYQPQIDVLTNQVTGVEALMRWNHPKLGLVGPNVFIPIAEQSGLINDLGEWCLFEACYQAKEMASSLSGENPGIYLSVNVSANQLARGGLSKTLEKVLSETKINPKTLKLEITETVIMQDPDIAVKELECINSLGVEIAIDDFGTGYSSLSYLGLLPLTCLKIDRCFVTDICKNETNQKIVLSIINLAKSLELSVIGEGVETQEELDFLYDQGCKIIQGYYFSKPLLVDEVLSFIKNTNLTSNTG